MSRSLILKGSVSRKSWVMSVVSVLGAAAAPTLGDYITESRIVRANSDVRVVANAMARMSAAVITQGQRPGGLQTYDLLVSPGAEPAIAAGVSDVWSLANGAGKVGLIDDQFVTNRPGYAGRKNSLPAGVRGWGGPYLDRPLESDPWGHRYAIRLGQGRDVTLVLSAGPDGIVQTRDGENGLEPAGDDIIAVVEGRW